MKSTRTAVRLFTSLLLLTAILNIFLNGAHLQRDDVSSAPKRHEWRVNIPDIPDPNRFHGVDRATVRRRAALANETHQKLWQDSDKIPPWMKEYFEWHEETRRSLNITNWDSQHYLLLRCVRADKKCAGASDRLKSLPSVLRMAYEAQPRRLLFLAWSRPAPLEEFLVPPIGGMNWSLPPWLAEAVAIEQQGPKFFMETPRAKKNWPTLKDPIARIKNILGADYYDLFRQPGEATFDQVYADVWRVMFKPSPAIASLIEQAMDDMNLEPRGYVGVHIRSLYVSDTRDHHEEVAAVQCASQIGPGLAVFVASDSRNTTQRAVDLSRNHPGITIVARDSHPVHLDRGGDFLVQSNDWKDRQASEFYDVFVDLYMLAESRCIAYGAGGYGKWASLIGGNQECSISHREANCTWN